MQTESTLSTLKERGLFFSLWGIIVFTSLMMPFFQENDLPFLLNDGRYIEARGLPTEDPFTMHDGMKFVMQQWLTTVIFWKVYTWFGIEGLYALGALTGMATLYGFYRLCLMVSKQNVGFSLIMLLVFGGFMNLIFFRIRPQSFSALLLMFAVLALEKYYRTQNKKYLLAMPVLSVALINLHGAIWPLIIVVMLPYIAASLRLPTVAGYFELGDRACLVPLLVTAAVVVAAAFVNPYGWEAIVYGANSYGSEALKNGVKELQPLTVRLEIGKIFFPLFLLIVAILAKRKTKLTYALFSLGFMYMSLDSIRNMIFFILFGLLPLAEYFADREIFSQEGAKAVSSVTRRQIMLLLVSVALLAGSVGSAVSDIAADFSENMIPFKEFVLILAIFSAAFAVYFGCRWQIMKFSLEGGERKKIIGFGFAMFLILSVAASIIGAKVPQKNYYISAEPGLRYIVEHDPRPGLSLWINANLGSYAGFYGFKPYMDTRMELFFKKNNGQFDYFEEMQELEAGLIHYRDFLAKYDFDYILTKEGDLLDTYLPHDGDYEVIYEYESETDPKTKERYHLFRLKAK